MITSSSFKIRFPEFTSVSDARIQVFIDDSVLILNETFWGTKYDLGLSYLTAHFLTLAEKSSNGNTGSIGQVANKSVDGVSISYNTASTTSQNDIFYNSTVYGQRYVVLRNNLGVAACVI